MLGSSLYIVYPEANGVRHSLSLLLFTGYGVGLSPKPHPMISRTRTYKSACQQLLCCRTLECEEYLGIFLTTYKIFPRNVSGGVNPTSVCAVCVVCVVCRSSALEHLMVTASFCNRVRQNVHTLDIVTGLHDCKKERERSYATCNQKPRCYQEIP